MKGYTIVFQYAEGQIGVEHVKADDADIAVLEVLHMKEAEHCDIEVMACFKGQHMDLLSTFVDHVNPVTLADFEGGES